MVIEAGLLTYVEETAISKTLISEAKTAHATSLVMIASDYHNPSEIISTLSYHEGFQNARPKSLYTVVVSPILYAVD